MDRGYLDFERLYHLHEAGSFFVTRAKSNLKAERRYSHPVARATGLICDQTIVKKRLNLPRSLYENLQILSLTLCEQIPLDNLLAQIDIDQNVSEAHNQMNLFD